MPSLQGRAPKSAYQELLKINNTGAGIDGTLRNIEDGAGNQTGIQIGTNMVAIFGYQFPASGFAANQVLRINSANNAFEWHTITTDDLADINLYAPLSSPAFTGVPTAPTALMGTNNTQIANTEFVNTAIPSQVSHLANDAGYLTALTAPVTSVAGRTGAITLAVTDVSGASPSASPMLTGSPMAPTPVSSDNSTLIATTAHVKTTTFNASGTLSTTSANITIGTDGGQVLAVNATTTGLAITLPDLASVSQGWTVTIYNNDTISTQTFTIETNNSDLITLNGTSTNQLTADIGITYILMALPAFNRWSVFKSS
jgi:hypothetical protein